MSRLALYSIPHHGDDSINISHKVVLIRYYSQCHIKTDVCNNTSKEDSHAEVVFDPDTVSPYPAGSSLNVSSKLSLPVNELSFIGNDLSGKVKNHSMCVVGEPVSSGYFIRTPGEIKTPREYSNYLYGSGIYGMSCRYNLPNSVRIIPNNPIIISDLVSSEFVESIFRLMLTYTSEGKYLHDVIIGWNIIFAMSNDPIFNEDGHQILSNIVNEDVIKRVAQNWNIGNNYPSINNSLLWDTHSTLDDRLLPSPIGTVIRSYGYDAIITYDKTASVSIVGNIIYPPIVGQVTYEHI